MVAKKAVETPAVEAVLVPFAYVTAKSGEVVQLVKGDAINAARYTKESLDHLRSIGFIGEA